MTRIVAATRNKHKIEEINAITREFGMDIVSRDDAGVPKIEIEEDGKTFEENSYKKAYEIMKLCGEITIADDSGLVVDALEGAPGIYSARFAGFPGLWPDDSSDAPEADTTDIDNNTKLLKLMEGVPFEKRTARFVSVITMVYPDGQVLTARGTVEGHLADEPSGDGGFGYDPLFIPLGYEETMATLGDDLKNSISHRANALKELRRQLMER